MRDLTYLDDKRVESPIMFLGDKKNTGFFIMRINGIYTKILATIDGEGDDKWEHVSVSHPNKIPSWETMAKVKELFFEDEEEVIQYHPKKSEYVNLHENCLHMWRPVNRNIITPPIYKEE